MERLYVSRELVKTISTLNESKPGDWQAGMAFLKAADYLFSDSSNDSTYRAITKADSFINNTVKIWDRIEKDIEIGKLTKELQNQAHEIRKIGELLGKMQMLTYQPIKYRIIGAEQKRMLGFIYSQDSLEIIGILPGTEAAFQGLMIGDTIQAVNSVPVTPQTIGQLLTNELNKNSSAEFLIKRHEQQQSFQLRTDQHIAGTIEVNYDGNWRGTFSKDILKMTNAEDAALTNCLLIVEIHNGDSNEFYRHHHWIERWDSGSTLYTPYYRDGKFNRMETFDSVEYVVMELKADQLAHPIRHILQYSGECLNEDVSRYCRDMKMRVEKLNYEEGFLGIYNAGVELSISGINSIPPCNIVVSYQSPPNPDVSLSWNSTSTWKPQGSFFPNSKSLRDARFNPIRPRSITVALTFPDTTYSPVFTVNLNQ